MPSQGCDRPLPRYRPRTPQLRHHRAGHCQPAGGVPSRRSQALYGGGGRRLPLQGAAPRNRTAHSPYPGESGASGRYPRRAGLPSRPPQGPSRNRRALQAAQEPFTRRSRRVDWLRAVGAGDSSWRGQERAGAGRTGIGSARCQAHRRRGTPRYPLGGTARGAGRASQSATTDLPWRTGHRPP